MPTSDALMGHGMPPHQALDLGGNPKSLTATGTTQGGAAKVLTKNTEILTSSSQTGVVIPAGAQVMNPYYFFNKNSDSAVIYAPVGDTLNGAASTTGLTLAQNKAAILYQYKKGAWASILTG